MAVRRTMFLGAMVALLTVVPAAGAVAADPIGTLDWNGREPESSSDVLAFKWGITGPQPSRTGNSVSRFKLGEFTFTKPMTAGSPRYVFDAATGKTIPAATFSFALAGALPASVNFCMTKVQISSVQNSASVDDPEPVQTVALRFQKIAMEYSAEVLNVVTFGFSPDDGFGVDFGHAHTICPNPG